MYNHDWVAHLRLFLEHAAPGEAFEVVHVGGTYRDIDAGQEKIYLYGSCYVKTEAGHRSCHIGNVEATRIKQPPFRI